MVSGRRQAVDSAFVKANASLSSLEEMEVAEESMKYYKELSSAEENTGEENTHRKKVRRDRPGKTGMNDTCRSTTGPDARVSQKHGKVAQLSVPAQDPESGIIDYGEDARFNTGEKLRLCWDISISTNRRHKVPSH
jgi:hypothetical protein